MKTSRKNQKPIDIDLHLKYRCPNTKCGYDHWLSLAETKVKNFKVVCLCGTVFTPKTIQKIQIKYAHKQKPKTKPKIQQPSPMSPSLSQDIIDRCCITLQAYGFSRNEAQDLVVEAHKQSGFIDCGDLVKLSLNIFGEQQNG